MIEYDKLILPNGLRVLFHKDKTSPIAAFNILYDVGARDEHKDRTGFAHLFEHLMFGGSKNIPDFDKAVQLAGGDNNAYTSNDVTNYYSTLPATNIESAFWLDSDRLNELAFSNKSLEVQRNVVVEEFKQTCLNQPYGDVWQLLRPLCYEVHSYSWSTIGKKIEHIEAHFKEIMLVLGLDLSDDSLKGTPYRVAKMYVKEMCSGLNPSNIPDFDLPFPRVSVNCSTLPLFL
jgi:predicted Zn-dependent peptidase